MGKTWLGGELLDAYWIRWRLHENGLSVDFEALDVFGEDSNGTVVYAKEEASGAIRPTEDPNAASFAVRGCVKWDGCSDWNWAESTHFCCRADAVPLGELMGRMYDIARKAMAGKWDGGE